MNIMINLSIKWKPKGSFVHQHICFLVSTNPGNIWITIASFYSHVLNTIRSFIHSLVHVVDKGDEFIARTGQLFSSLCNGVLPAPWEDIYHVVRHII